MNKEAFDVDLDRFITALERVDELLQPGYDDKTTSHKGRPTICTSDSQTDSSDTMLTLLFVWAQLASWSCIMVTVFSVSGGTPASLVDRVRSFLYKWTTTSTPVWNSQPSITHTRGSEMVTSHPVSST